MDGCDYSGPIRSVKSHITASTDGAHDGQHGMDFADALRKHAERRLNGETARFSEHESDDDSVAAEEAVGDDSVAVEHADDDDSMAAEEAVGDGGGMVMHAIDDDDERAEAGSERDEQETPVVEPVDEIDAETDDDDSVPLPGGIGFETALAAALVLGLATGVVGGEFLRSLSTPSSGSDETDTDDDGGDNQNQNRGSGSVVGLS